MDPKKLSPREEALLAAARREAAARKEASPAPSPAERLAQLMAEEHAETLEKKRKMRRYGIAISATILALFVVWLLRSLSPRKITPKEKK
jgi:hypothetical protein